MKKVIPLIILLLLGITNASAYSYIHGIVYKGQGTSERADNAFVSGTGDNEYIETSSNSSGNYSIWPLYPNEPGEYYEGFAKKLYDGEWWTKTVYNIWVPSGYHADIDFHLHEGYDPKK